MPANVYECMFLLDTNKVAGDEANAAKTLQGILERNQAEILSHRRWDERKLAYPIGNHKKGLYYLTYFRSDGKSIPGIERDFAISELVMRMMILKIEPKLADGMLAVGQNEQMSFYQTVTEPQGDDDLLGEGMGDRPRRGPRRDEGPEDKGG